MASEKVLKQIARQIVFDRTSKEGLQRFVYGGDCMRPILKEGDLMFVKAVSPSQLRLGDIVIFKDKKQNYIHRYLFTRWDREPRLITKADRYLNFDSPVSFELFIGKVVRILTKKGAVDLEKMPIKVLFFFLGTASLFEVVLMKFLRYVHPRSLGISTRLKQRIQRWVQAPKSVLEMIFPRH